MSRRSYASLSTQATPKASWIVAFTVAAIWGGNAHVGAGFDRTVTHSMMLPGDLKAYASIRYDPAGGSTGQC
jgi:hypothetical protein